MHVQRPRLDLHAPEFDSPFGALATELFMLYGWVLPDPLALSIRAGRRTNQYLLVLPSHEGELPADGYFVVNGPTFSNLVLYRTFVKGCDIHQPWKPKA